MPAKTRLRCRVEEFTHLKYIFITARKGFGCFGWKGNMGLWRVSLRAVWGCGGLATSKRSGESLSSCRRALFRNEILFEVEGWNIVVNSGVSVF